MNLIENNMDKLHWESTGELYLNLRKGLDTGLSGELNRGLDDKLWGELHTELNQGLDGELYRELHLE